MTVNRNDIEEIRRRGILVAMTEIKHTDTPYSEQIAKLMSMLAEMDEQSARELLEDTIDHAIATVSEQQSAGQPNKSLKTVMDELGVDS
ncbi:MAG: hypothetical protein AAFR90_15575 [Pseudomonadota bacterium]